MGTTDTPPRFSCATTHYVGLATARTSLLKRMLQVEIIAYLTAEHADTDSSVPTVPIDFVQLSAHIEQDFAEGFTADQKLAGMSLHGFGAFLKRSWRANDWIWGRLDAVKILMLVLLTPEMIRGYHRKHHPHGHPWEVVEEHRPGGVP